MKILGWKYYNHAVIPSTAPNEIPDVYSVKNGDIWKCEKKPLLARWTTDFDCGYETNWWYVIKDDVFDVAALKAKRRYEINKGIKNFDVRIIEPGEYKEELYHVQISTFSAYPGKYRSKIDKIDFMHNIDNWQAYTIFGAFCRETNELTGYARLSKEIVKFLNLNVLKTNPVFEKYSVNAALMHKIVTCYAEFLSDGGIICDGARSINHETAFQDYLEKYFGFRKAYCHLNIVYNPRIFWLIKLLYPARKLFLIFDNIGIVHQLNSVIRMEEICRKGNIDEKTYNDKLAFIGEKVSNE